MMNNFKNFITEIDSKNKIAVLTFSSSQEKIWATLYFPFQECLMTRKEAT
jgi:hypothetical protein